MKKQKVAANAMLIAALMLLAFAVPVAITGSESPRHLRFAIALLLTAICAFSWWRALTQSNEG
jgi:hypothetical protein